MFVVDADKTINITRGDIGVINITAKVSTTSKYVFKVGDVVRFSVMQANKCEKILLSKDVEVNEEKTEVSIELVSADTKIGEIVNKPTTYWYEVVLNPDTEPETIIGYDKDGAKKFILYPEGGDE